MLVTLAAILGILWLLGVVAIHISSPLIHLIIVVAIIMFVYDLLTRRGSSV